MRRFPLTLAATIAAMIVACTPTDGALEKVDEARARNDGPTMWVATDEDSTVYLYGTVHLLPVGLDWQRDDMLEAFAQAGTVFFEIPSTTVAQRRAERLTSRDGFLLPGERLSADFDAYETKLLEVAALEADVPLQALDTMRAWLAADILLVAAAEAEGMSSALAADEALKSLANRQRKYVDYLDTVDAQIALSSDVPAAEQRAALRDVLENYSRLGPSLRAISDAWVQGDVERLERLTREPMSEVARDRLFTSRNAAWADRIADTMEGSGTVFVAVGVGHLVGERSLQEALEERGVEVKRYLAYQGENVIETIDLDTGRNVSGN